MLGRLLLDLLPILGFGLAVYGLFGLLQPLPTTRLVGLMMANAYMAARAAFALARMLLSPASNHLRLIPSSDAAARAGIRWLRRLMLVGVGGYTLAEAGLLLGLPWSAYDAILNLTLLVISAAAGPHRAAAAGGGGGVPAGRPAAARGAGDRHPPDAARHPRPAGRGLARRGHPLARRLLGDLGAGGGERHPPPAGRHPADRGHRRRRQGAGRGDRLGDGPGAASGAGDGQALPRPGGAGGAIRAAAEDHRLRRARLRRGDPAAGDLGARQPRLVQRGHAGAAADRYPALDRLHPGDRAGGVGGGEFRHPAPADADLPRCPGGAQRPGPHPAADAAHRAGGGHPGGGGAERAGPARAERGAAAGRRRRRRPRHRLRLADPGAGRHHRHLPAAGGCGGGRRRGDLGRADRGGGEPVDPLDQAAGDRWQRPYRAVQRGDDGDQP